MDDKNSFLDHVNEKNDSKSQNESFQEEAFIKNKRNYFGVILMALIGLITLAMVYFLTNQKLIMIDLQQLTLEEAETLLDSSKYAGEWTEVVVRSPLGPVRYPALYIFTVPDQGWIAVNTWDKSVFTLD